MMSLTVTSNNFLRVARAYVLINRASSMMPGISQLSSRRASVHVRDKRRKLERRIPLPGLDCRGARPRFCHLIAPSMKIAKKGAVGDYWAGSRKIFKNKPLVLSFPSEG